MERGVDGVASVLKVDTEIDGVDEETSVFVLDVGVLETDDEAIELSGEGVDDADVGTTILGVEIDGLVLDADFVDLETIEDTVAPSPEAELDDAGVDVKVLEVTARTVLREVTSTVEISDIKGSEGVADFVEAMTADVLGAGEDVKVLEVASGAEFREATSTVEVSDTKGSEGAADFVGHTTVDILGGGFEVVEEKL